VLIQCSCMIRIPAVRQKGKTDTIGTQLLYTITVASQWDGMSIDIVHDISYGCEEGPYTTSPLAITHARLGQTCQQVAWAASVVWTTGKPHPQNKLCTCESAPLCSPLGVLQQTFSLCTPLFYATKFRVLTGNTQPLNPLPVFCGGHF